MSATVTSIHSGNMVVEEIYTPPKYALPPLKKRVSRPPQLLTFDANEKAHRAAFAHFLVHKKWPEGVRFVEEHPFTSAVTTAEHKLLNWTLRKEIEALQGNSNVSSQKVISG